MDEERFEALLDAYGGATAHWPEAERASALRYLAATPDARRSRASAQELDQLLDSWAADDASPALRARLSAALPSARGLRPRALWLSGAGLAAACFVGLLVGADIGEAGLQTRPTLDRNSDAAVTAALDGSAEFTPNLDEALS